METIAFNSRLAPGANGRVVSSADGSKTVSVLSGATVSLAHMIGITSSIFGLQGFQMLGFNLPRPISWPAERFLGVHR